MRRTIVAAVVAAALVGAGASAAVTAHDDDWSHPMMSDGQLAAASELEYLAEMVAHHQEAIAAARQLQRSDRPQIRQFGQSIVASQSAQNVQMKKRLVDWYPGRSTRVDYQPMMRDLTRLSGDRLDRVFLHDMIGHHMAAVMMSQMVIVSDLAEHPWVRLLAQTIRHDQHVEIFQMRRWLDRWW